MLKLRDDMMEGVSRENTIIDLDNEVAHNDASPRSVEWLLLDRRQAPMTRMPKRRRVILRPKTLGG